MDLRRPTDADRDAMVALLTLSLGMPPEWRTAFRDELPLRWFLCTYEGDELLGTTLSYPLDQWFGGRPVAMAGIAGVATVPERRGTGVARELVTATLRAERERGAVLSTLFPATVPVYRSLGYEYAGVYSTHRVRLRELPRAPDGRVEVFRGDDTAPLERCFREFTAGQNGCTTCEDPYWWRMRVLRRWVTDETRRTVVVRGPDGSVHAYAVFQPEPLQGVDHGTKVECTHLVWTEPEALRTLLGYFRRFQGVGQFLEWQGPPNDPIALLLEEQTIEQGETFRNMSRLLDVPRALEARGYTPVSGEAVVAVEDPQFPDNAGPFRIRAKGGWVRVERVDAEVKRPVPIGALSAMFTGYLRASDLARAGAIEGDGTVEFLDELFSGPPPWTPDFF